MQNYYVTPHSLAVSSQPSHPLFTFRHIKSASLLLSKCPQAFPAVMASVLPVLSPFCRSNCHPSVLSLNRVSAKSSVPAQDITARTVLTSDRVSLGSDFTMSIWPISISFLSWHILECKSDVGRSCFLFIIILSGFNNLVYYLNDCLKTKSFFNILYDIFINFLFTY